MDTYVKRIRKNRPGRGLNFQKVWAALMEEKEEREQLNKEIAERQKETDQQIKETNRQMGDLHRRFGKMAEHLVAPGIADRFNELGFHFDIISHRGMEIRDEEGKTKAEVDMALENGEYIMAVEIKATVRLNDVEHHIRRLEIIREAREKKQEKPKKIQGAIAGAIFGSVEKQAVIEAGFYALVQSGDTMVMDIPEDFVPRKW